MKNSLNTKKGVKHRLNFNIDLLEKDNIGSFYSKLFNLENSKLVHDSSKINLSLFDNCIICINDVPNYLNVEKSTALKKIKLKKVNTYEGSLINLKNYSTIDAYLAKEVSTKERSEIRRRQKRLDNCIKPTYKMYYGDISKTDYDVVFNDYKNMLVRRLEQKQSYWEELDYWQERYDSTYKLIIEKKACIFVIYYNTTPISIYINSIFDTIVFNEVVAYDIDYSRFNIGILIFIKTIEWSINNGFDIIDMSKGDFSYKKRFRNGAYTFQNHFFYSSNNKSILFKAKAEIFKLKLIYKLLPWFKKLKINKLYTAYKRVKNRHFFKEEKSLENFDLETKKLTVLNISNNLVLIDSNSEVYMKLKKAIIDFAFLSVEYIDDLLIYQEKTNDNTFYFKGKNSIQKTIVK